MNLTYVDVRAQARGLSNRRLRAIDRRARAARCDRTPLDSERLMRWVAARDELHARGLPRPEPDRRPLWPPRRPRRAR